jgi:putative zinc finger protein
MKRTSLGYANEPIVDVRAAEIAQDRECGVEPLVTHAEASGMASRVRWYTGWGWDAGWLARAIEEHDAIQRDIECTTPHDGPCEPAAWNDGPLVCVVPLRSAPEPDVLAIPPHPDTLAQLPRSWPPGTEPCADRVDFINGELDASRADAFRAHLRDCRPCRDVLPDEVELAAALSMLRPEDGDA